MHMNSDELEKAFSDFIDGECYDKAENVLFELIRLAFVSGWNEAKRDNLRLITADPLTDE